MLKIKKPGEMKMIDVGYDAVFEFKNYYAERGSKYRFVAYNDFLTELDAAKSNNTTFNEQTFEEFVNNYLNTLRKEQREVRKQLRKEKNQTKRTELKQKRNQLAKSISFISEFSKVERARIAAVDASLLFNS